MGFIAPKERKHLSADALFGFVRSLFANVPDHRSDDTDITLTDALMAGFAMFSLKCPSLLDFDKQRAEGNLRTIYGIERAPCDSYMREMLDPISPASLRPLFKGVFRHLQRGKALEEMVFFKGCYLLALDGTGAIPLKSPCACRLSRRPPLTQVIELRLGLSKGSALQAEPLAMRSKALPFLSQVLRWSVTQGPQ